MTACYTVIIPARYASTRLPGKPLQTIAGKPMVQHVYEQAQKSSASRVVVATDDQRIADAVTAFGGEWCMTNVKHESGTDRLCEAANNLGLADDELIVNVQGDEPLLPPENIDQLASIMANGNAAMATLSIPIESYAEFIDPNAVKVLADNNDRALYFSRAPIPWPRDASEQLPTDYAAQRHIGIYAYRVSFLRQFVNWPMAALEQTEKLEQLRAMANGVAIYVQPAKVVPPAGVDTAEDLARVRELLGGS